VNARIIDFEVDDGDGLPVDVSSDARGTLKWIDMSNWDNEPIPQRKWAILNRVPLNQAGLFSGEGGTRKVDHRVDEERGDRHRQGVAWLVTRNRPSILYWRRR
jgi:hypothetical protein